MRDDYTISTVKTGADSIDLVDLPTAKDELGIPVSDATKDAQIARQITQISAAVNSYCRRVFAVQTYRDQFRRGWGYGRGDSGPLNLSNGPVIAISSLTEDGTALDTDTDVEMNPGAGLLYRLRDARPSCWAACDIVVEYDAGYAEVPADVVDAVLQWLALRYSARRENRDPLVKAIEQPGVGRQEFWLFGPPMTGPVPQQIAGLLDTYRIPMIG